MAIEDVSDGRDEWTATGVCSLETSLGLFMSSVEIETGLQREVVGSISLEKTLSTEVGEAFLRSLGRSLSWRKCFPLVLYI